MTLPWWKPLDRLDTWYAGLEPKAEAFFGKLIASIQWSWNQMTLLSVLIIIMIIVVAGLAWLQFADRKKLAHRAYWRGVKYGQKKK